MLEEQGSEREGCSFEKIIPATGWGGVGVGEQAGGAAWRAVHHPSKQGNSNEGATPGGLQGWDPFSESLLMGDTNRPSGSSSVSWVPGGVSFLIRACN